MDCVRGGDDVTLRVRKAWAFHGDFVVCLLGGWETSGALEGFATAVEQCRQREPVRAGLADGSVAGLQDTKGEFVDVRWAVHNGIGYVPVGDGASLRLRAGDQKGSWHDISRRYQAKAISEKVLRVSLKHGPEPRAGGFVLVLGANVDGSQDLAAHPPWEVLQNDGICQCLRFEDGLHLAAFYEPGEVASDVSLGVDVPCLAMWSGGHLRVCDPTNRGGTLTAKWNGREVDVALPDGGTSAEVTASETPPG
jgi:hypothetical protein